MHAYTLVVCSCVERREDVGVCVEKREYGGSVTPEVFVRVGLGVGVCTCVCVDECVCRCCLFSIVALSPLQCVLACWRVGEWVGVAHGICVCAC